MTKPISPQDLPQPPTVDIPSFVIEIVNDLLVKNNTGKDAIVVFEADILAEIGKWPETEDHLVNFLKFAPLYRDAGWAVSYHSGILDTRAYYQFRKV